MFKRKNLAIFLISALLLTGCGILPPIAQEEHLLSTKIEGQKSYEGTFGDTNVSVDAFRDLTYIAISDTTPRKVLFKETKDGTTYLVLREGQEEEAMTGIATYYETLTPEGELLYMLYDNPNRIWTLKNKEGDNLFRGEITNMFKQTGNELVFASKNADGSNEVYYNGKKVWEHPSTVLQFHYDPAASRHLAVVAEANPNFMTLKTSFKDVPGIYQHVHGLEIDGDKVSFLGQKKDASGEWLWYLDGKEKTIPFDVKEVSAVNRGDGDLGAIVNIPQGWFFMSSDGQEELISGTAQGLSWTEDGWKTILQREEKTFVYNISKQAREVEDFQIVPITLNGGVDLWFAHRGIDESHWKINRGQQEVVELLKYIAPIFLNGQPYLLGEKGSGSVDLYQLNP
ncbi:MAG: hypothetical protein AB7J40_03405 [Candidatus Altimarinota bacterium]